MLDDASAGCEITFEDIEGEASDILLEMKFSSGCCRPSMWLSLTGRLHRISKRVQH